MSQQPPGPDLPWQPAGQQPWAAQRQPQHPAQPQMPYQPFAPPAAVTRPSIWRIAVGVWLGLILFFLTMVILAVALGSLVSNEFRSTFDSGTSGTGDSSNSSPSDPFGDSN